MPTRSSAPQTYWLPLDYDSTGIASLGAGDAYLDGGIAIADPVDSVNQVGTIVGGQIEAVLYNGDVGSRYAPEFCVWLLPPNVALPGNPAAAGTSAWNKLLKEYENYVWLRGNMDRWPLGNVSADGDSFVWKMQLTTSRKVNVRGTKVAFAIWNADPSIAYGSGAGFQVLLDLYMILQ